MSLKKTTNNNIQAGYSLFINIIFIYTINRNICACAIPRCQRQGKDLVLLFTIGVTPQTTPDKFLAYLVEIDLKH